MKTTWEGLANKCGAGGFTEPCIDTADARITLAAFEDWLRAQRAGLAPWERGPRVRITLERLEPIPASKEPPLPDLPIPENTKWIVDDETE